MKAKEYASKFDKCRDTEEEIINDLRELMSEFYNEFADGLYIPKGKVSPVQKQHVYAKVNSRIMEFHKKWVSMCDLIRSVELKKSGFLGMLKTRSEAIYNDFLKLYPDIIGKE